MIERSQMCLRRSVVQLKMQFQRLLVSSIASGAWVLLLQVIVSDAIQQCLFFVLTNSSGGDSLTRAIAAAIVWGFLHGMLVHEKKGKKKKQ